MKCPTCGGVAIYTDANGLTECLKCHELFSTDRLLEFLFYKKQAGKLRERKVS